MLSVNNRAFKEWAIACEAMKLGEQVILIRKGGIREEDGVFRMSDSEFFLLPTYEHQNARLLQPAYVERLRDLQSAAHDSNIIHLDAYAVADVVVAANDPDKVHALASYHIWNTDYIEQRFDFNPYDPLYVILMRVYRLPEKVSLPMRAEYAGCKSWVTLDQPLSTAEAIPALSDAEYAERRASVLSLLDASFSAVS